MLLSAAMKKMTTVLVHSRDHIHGGVIFNNSVPVKITRKNNFLYKNTEMLFMYCSNTGTICEIFRQ